MADKLKVIIFLSSTRVGTSVLGEGSWGDRVGKVLKTALDDAGFNTKVWDPKDNEYGLLKQPLHLVPDASDFPQWLKDKKVELDIADAFVICSAEYNSALPPALTNMLDHFPPSSYRHRPVGLVTYSVNQMGGARIQPTLKAFSTELGMVPIPIVGNVARVHEKFHDDGTLKDDSVMKYFIREARELAWYAEALKRHKTVEPVPTQK